jgi:hypothetical protein
MQRILVAIVTAVILIAGLVPASAASANGRGNSGTRGGPVIRNPRVEPPPVPNMQSRIPAPLPQPAQPPVVNGPVGPSGLPPMGNGMR